nr:MAG TPA: 14-3-3 protein gamma [Herelleviridae sp.]
MFSNYRVILDSCPFLYKRLRTAEKTELRL